MNSLNPFFAIIIYIVAFITAYLLNLKYKLTNDGITRYETIDGMRGFLAIGVFIHHSSIWYQYLQIDSWESPKSNLYCQLGQTSVSLFFMITSFLFITKLINNESKKIDWNSFFISRFFRLVPMYFVSIFLIVLIVFAKSNWELRVSLSAFIQEMLYWVSFTYISVSGINGTGFIELINAGVVWSLPYEWLFYFSLPIISLLIFRRLTSWVYMTISIFFILLFYMNNDFNYHHLMSFSGGAIAPFFIKYYSKKIDFNSLFFTAIILLCLVLILFFDNSENILCKFLIIVVFNLIALGNNVFGLLKSTTLKFLGEISYSTYLIHGIIIFTVMYFYFNLEEAKKISSTDFWIIIVILTPVIVVSSFVSYKNIEKPFLNYSKKIAIKK